MRPFAGSALPVFAMALFVLSCGGGTEEEVVATPDLTATPVTATAAEVHGGTLYGVAGLIPPHWPNPSDEDWRTLFGQYAETGTLIGVYQAYDESEGPVRIAFDLAQSDGLVPVVGVGLKADASDGGAVLSFDPADPTARERFIESVLGLVREHEIEYLLVDTEVDRIEADDPVAFEAFVGLYIETYDAVKAISPGTKVFTAFQLEELRGEAFLTGREWEPRWELIERFGDRLDLVGFTSYPFFDYEDPAAIPDDYYAEAARRAGDRPVAFTELGWSSAPLSSAPASGYGGSEQEQAAFVERFAELVAGLDVELVLWSFPNDVGDSINPSFEFLSLRTNEGAAKPALPVWQRLAGAR